MAKYLISVLADGTEIDTPEIELAIDNFNEQLQANGNWVFAGGLGTPSMATVIDGRDGEAVLTDGPFAETKEFAAGFWMIEAPHLDAALQLAAQGSKHCNRRVEVRPVLEG